MGHHYVPQKYLRGFATPSDYRLIWMYDKVKREWSRAAIKKVAQEIGYYDEDVERDLAGLIEHPAHAALGKLRTRVPITEEERTAIAIYIGSMMVRVPRRRRKAEELIPDALEQTVADLRDAIIGWAMSGGDPLLVERRLQELDAAYLKFTEEPPEEVRRQVRAPWPSENILGAISRMTWRVVINETPSAFLTTDNPAYFFESWGVGREESELTFPLASDLALVASRQGEPGATLAVLGTHQLVKEINRRVASGAERFVFYHSRRQWVATLADCRSPHLSRILW